MKPRDRRQFDARTSAPPGSERDSQGRTGCAQAQPSAHHARQPGQQRGITTCGGIERRLPLVAQPVQVSAAFKQVLDHRPPPTRQACQNALVNCSAVGPGLAVANCCTRASCPNAAACQISVRAPRSARRLAAFHCAKTTASGHRRAAREDTAPAARYRPRHPAAHRAPPHHRCWPPNAAEFPAHWR